MLIEREVPLQTLLKLAERAKNGRGGIVLLSGEAGIGKTTLLECFHDQIGIDYKIMWGGCDPLFTPRTLGPVHDMAKSFGREVNELLAQRSAPASLFSAIHSALDASSQPTILICEDLHWADNATLDMIKYLGRRVWFLNALLVLSFRSDEIAADHPLTQVLGELPSSATHRIDLEPLSLDGVVALSGASDTRASELFEITQGNPFFVTELLAAQGEGTKNVPASIKDAVASRLRRLQKEERNFLEELSLIPGSVSPTVLIALYGEEADRLSAKCIERGILLADENGTLRFRHELARLATSAAMPASHRTRAHTKILTALLAGRDAELKSDQIVHHAASARDSQNVLKHAPEAARRAAEAGGHREAALHLATALRFINEASPETAATLYENWAYEAGLALRIDDEVLEARRHAISLWRALGRSEKVAENLRGLSRLHWYRGQSTEARHYSDQAIQVLEDMPPSIERALAYSLRSQLCMLNDHMDEAVLWGKKALELEAEFEDLDVRIHALNNIGTAMIFRNNPEGIAYMDESLELSLAHGFHEHAARAYTNLGEYGVEFCDFELAERVITEGIAFDIEHDLDAWTHYLQGRLGLLRMKQGRLRDAEAITSGVITLERLTLLMRLPALQVLAKTRMRLGDATAPELMTQALYDALATDEMQYIVPARLTLVEAAWLNNNPEQASEHLSYLLSLEKTDRHAWHLGEIAVWAHRYQHNLPSYLPDELPKPFQLELDGDLHAAAKEWERIGAPYKAALVLMQTKGSSAAAAFDRALELLEPMEAKAAIAKTRTIAKAMGIDVKLSKPRRGPYRAARNHPLGLTSREQEILRHMLSGETNREIAEILSRSQRTIEHHVSSILAKLSATNRLGAMLRIQNEPWLLQDESSPQ
jgi:DNA-binding CsgD family transcriptional regulator